MIMIKNRKTKEANLLHEPLTDSITLEYLFGREAGDCGIQDCKKQTEPWSMRIILVHLTSDY